MAYKCDIFRERRSKINEELIRKHATSEDLLFRTRNVVIAEEGMSWFNVLFSSRQEYKALLEDEAKDDPVFSKKAVEQYIDKKPKNRRNKVSSFATKDDYNLDDNADCIYCSKDHKFKAWNAFINQKLKEKIKV